MADDTAGTERGAAATGSGPDAPTAPPAYPYTVHDDAVSADRPVPAADPGDPVPDGPEGTDRPEGSDGPGPTGSRGPDPVGLLAGLAALAVAILAITDTLDAIDPRWLLACGAIVVGAVVLSATLGRRARHDR